MSDDNKKSLWQKLRALGLGTIAVAFTAGIIFWGGFNTVMEWTNTEQFCISCHEMRDNVYEEYRNTIHYQNRTGVRAICSDCHVPREWVPKMIRKIQATRELYGKVMGTIDTPEKFEAHRLRLAENEWRRMRANNSQECRNCHSFEYFDYSVQGRRSNQAHQSGLAEGKTCIDCHKGIAHSLPPIEQDIGLERPAVTPDVFHPPSTQQ
ncbi:NapC/NirT family cytochrome c [Pseudothauera lacus]|uniref:Cytochrome c-type protein n=1 Tax=Pseudothauera lacus TaxID=2136175 RepID=A0A2T4IBC4_9RHOO|nr:NapC/NirT family cytochrome c [Pseudothauera lacus]PTD95071.1 cytochrome c-type protein NapC [Pseudothauera lacus]